MIAAAAVAVGPLLYMGVGSIPRPTALDRGTAPLGLVDSWTASEVDPAAPTWAPGFAGVDDRVAWRIRGEGVTLEGARHFFVDQRWGEELIQFSNQIAPDSLVISDRLLGPVGPRGRLVREALVRNGVSGRVVWYWYRVAGFDTPFASKAKLLEVLSFFGRSAAAELITLSAACDAESCLRAAQALRAATGGPPIPDSGAPSSSLTGKGDAPTDSTVSRAPG